MKSTNKIAEKLVFSKQRVADHGEVFTPAWLVDAMLDLVKDETEPIDSRFSNPAFNYPEFEVIENDAWVNRFIMSAGQWIERTAALGILVKAGHYGATNAIR